MLEQCLVEHCAPTLANLKSGSLFSYFYTDEFELAATVEAQNRELAHKGISIVILQKRARSALIYVYREKRLAADLARGDARDLLAGYGYAGCDVPCALCRLRERVGDSAEFPHEIGLFLSYPPEDVRGFIKHRGQNCRCVGCWKVYGDEGAARKRFAQYKKCTSAYRAQLAKGKSIERLTVAG